MIIHCPNIRLKFVFNDFLKDRTNLYLDLIIKKIDNISLKCDEFSWWMSLLIYFKRA